MIIIITIIIVKTIILIIIIIIIIIILIITKIIIIVVPISHPIIYRCSELILLKSQYIFSIIVTHTLNRPTIDYYFSDR